MDSENNLDFLIPPPDDATGGGQDEEDLMDSIEVDAEADGGGDLSLEVGKDGKPRQKRTRVCRACVGCEFSMLCGLCWRREELKKTPAAGSHPPPY